MKKRSLLINVLVFLGALLCLAGCAKKPSPVAALRDESAQRREAMAASSAYDQARQRFAANDLKEAQRQIDVAIALNPHSVEAHVLRTQIMLEVSDSEKDLQAAVDAGVKIAPNEARFYYYAGVFYDRRGDNRQALKNYQKAAELDDNTVQYKIATAEAMIEINDLAAAEAYLQKAQNRHPNAAGILQTRGHLAQINQQLAQAKIYFTEATLLAPEQTALKVDLATVLFRTGEFDKALKYLEPLASDKSFKQRTDLQLMLAQCYLECNRPVPARQLLKTLANTPATATYEVWAKMADVALVLNDRQLLRSAAEKMIALKPSAEDGYLALTRYWELSGDPQQAIATLTNYKGEPSALFSDYRNSLRK